MIVCRLYGNGSLRPAAPFVVSPNAALAGVDNYGAAAASVLARQDWKCQPEQREDASQAAAQCPDQLQDCLAAAACGQQDLLNLELPSGTVPGDDICVTGPWNHPGNASLNSRETETRQLPVA